MREAEPVSGVRGHWRAPRRRLCVVPQCSANSNIDRADADTDQFIAERYRFDDVVARRHNLAFHNLACHNLARDRLGERAVTRLRGDVVRNARDRGRRIGRAFGAIVPHGPGTADGPPREPVIVLFHGFADIAANIVDMSGIGTIAVGHGVIVVAPEATGSPPSWHIGQSEFGDVQFTDAVLALVRASSWRRHECHLVGRLQCRVGVGGCVRLLAHARYCGDLDALWTAAADLPVGHHTQHHDGARNR